MRQEDKTLRERVKNRITAENGFTIVEIVVVVVLLSVCLYPLGMVLMRVLRESNDDQRLATCSFLAVEAVETTRALSQCYTTKGTCPGGNTDGWETSGFYNKTPPCNYPYPFDRYECEVQYVDSKGEGQKMREIQARVWYDENDNNIWDVNETDVLLETTVVKRHPIP